MYAFQRHLICIPLKKFSETDSTSSPVDSRISPAVQNEEIDVSFMYVHDIPNIHSACSTHITFILIVYFIVGCINLLLENIRCAFCSYQLPFRL